MPAALLTRNTLVEIGNLATYMDAEMIADGLGWKLDRLRRVAKAHGIKLKEPEGPPPPTPPPAPPPKSDVELLREKLTRHQRQVFDLIANAESIHRRDVAIAMRVQPTAVSEVVKGINRRIAAGGMRIISSRGSDGGYRLVRQ